MESGNIRLKKGFSRLVSLIITQMTPQSEPSSTSPHAAGVRELHNRTSELVRQVAAGASIDITLHGEPVARLVPVKARTSYERLRSRGLIREGKKRGFVPAPIELPEGVTVSDLLNEQRG